MDNKEVRYTGSTLREIFDELEETVYTLEEGLSVLTVLEEACHHDTDSKDICGTLGVLYDHLHFPILNLKTLQSAGRQLI